MILFDTEAPITQDVMLLDRALDALHKAKISCKYGNTSSSGGSRELSVRMSLASGCYGFYQIKAPRDLERAQSCIAQAQKERR